MKSIQINRYGGSDVIEVKNSASAPNPSSGKILVNVKTAGVNPAHWKIREGYFQQRTPLQFPSTLGVSAWQGIIENIRLSRDQKILIHGGAGGIGSIAIQLAKRLGVYVATTASTNDEQFVQELGANQVIDYETENFEDILHDYDAVFDTVGGDTYKRSFKVLKKGSGIITSMLEQPNSELMNRYGVKAF